MVGLRTHKFLIHIYKMDPIQFFSLLHTNIGQIYQTPRIESHTSYKKKVKILNVYYILVWLYLADLYLSICDILANIYRS